MKYSWIERLVFMLSAAFFVFLYGFLTYRYDLFPSEYLERAIDKASSIISKPVPHYMQRAVYDREGAISLEPSEIQPGLTLITSHWPQYDWRSGIVLIDEAGQQLHQWKADPLEVFPEEPKRANAYVHGSYLFPNGDVLFNIEYAGLVLMDSCGKVKWKLGYKDRNYVTHHCLTRNQEGNFWICGQVRWFPDDPESEAHVQELPGLELPLYEDHLLEVSSEGEILRDINLVKALYDNGLERYLVKIADTTTRDVVHLNDIEALPDNIAAEYPMFESGDLVVSMRGINMVLVMDPDTGKVKWHETDPFLKQHDPDFTGDGWITMFDNNMDFTERGTMLGGSRILAMQPHTGKTRIVYPTDDAPGFYTRLAGKWQQLDNGNMLITEARPGRAFEVTPDGRMVWEWIHERYDGEQIPEVLEATRYPMTHDQVSAWACGPGDG